MIRGKFVTFEGVEGSGKSLQLQLLAEELRRLSIPFHATLEPGGTPFGQELRKVLLRAEGPPRNPVSELLLYLADRYQHLQEVVEPNLERGITVISDRYHDATLAYQGYAREIGVDRIERLAELLGIREPDLTLVFDIDVRTGIERARHRNQQENQCEFGRFEAEDLQFHEKVRAGYLHLAERYPQRIAVIDATGSPVEVFEKVLSVLRGRFRNG